MSNEPEENEGANLTSDTNLKVGFKSSDSENQSAEEGRQAWGGKAEFLFSCLSYAVGLGNVWRFPYMCYKNGGGAFIIPFFVMLICVGIPLMFLETCFGQYSATGPISVWKASPIFTGVGWAMCLITFSGSIYYNMLIAWTLFYLYQSVTSFGSELPWTTCSAEWNTDKCLRIGMQMEMNKCNKTGGFFSFSLNNTCLMPNSTSYLVRENDRNAQSLAKQMALNGTPSDYAKSMNANYLQALSFNATKNRTELFAFLGKIMDIKTSSDEYFHNFVLSLSDGFHDMGYPKWQLILCLFCAWVIVILCLCRGVKTAGKAVYVTGLFPYLVLTILIIRGLTLDGAAEGIKYFFIPKWERLLSPKVWGDAAIQVFFSLSSGWGGIIALSSYNKFHNNALLDALIVSIGDGLTSIYAGMTVFCVLGYLSKAMSVPIEEVATGGAGLAFVVYPDIVSSLPLSPLWATLFFAMLMTLGLGTMISNINTIKTAICDNFPEHLQKGYRPFMVLCSICGAAFLLGMPCTTSGGAYVLQLLDNYCCTYAVLVVGFLELVVISWVYGVDEFLLCVDDIMGEPINRVWKYIWMFISPALIVAVSIFTFSTIESSSFANYTFPIGADLFGAAISLGILTPIPIIAAYKTYKLRLPNLSFWQRARTLMKPDSEWGREMGRKPKGYYAAANTDKAYESRQPLTATGSFVQSNTTVQTATHAVSQNKV